MIRINRDSSIKLILFFYILSLFLFTYRSDLTIFSNGLALLLMLVIWFEFFQKKKKLIINNLMVLYLVFLFISAISVFYAVDQSIALSRVKTLILVFLVMVSLINYIDSYAKLGNIINYYIYSGAIASIYILVNYQFTKGVRFDLLGNQNVIGLIIGISITLCYYYIVAQKKYLYLLFFAITIPTLLLTGSRQALLFVFMNFMMISLFNNCHSIKSIIKFGAYTIVILMVLYQLIFNIPLFYNVIGFRIENILSFIMGNGTSEGSLNTRANMLEIGLNLMEKRPYLGYGIDNYRVLYNLVTGEKATYAHNNFIDLTVGVGIIGVISFYVIIFVVIINLIQCIKQIENKLVCQTFIAIFISYLMLSISSVYYWNKHFNYLLAIGSIIYSINYCYTYKLSNAQLKENFSEG